MVSLPPPSSLPVVGVLVDGRTYRHLVYLLLAIPLGFVYSTLFSFGFAFGLLLSVVLVGLVVLLALILGSRLAAGFERWLADRLLGTDLAPYDDVPDDAGGGLASVRKYLDAASTWRGLGFLSLKFAVSIVAFVPLFALANGLPLVFAPVRYPYVADFGESDGEPVTWAIETLPEALVAVPVGVVGVLVALHLTNLVAYVARQMATALLGVTADASTGESAGESATGESATGESMTDETERDAPSAVDADGFIPAEAVDPESRAGRGPDDGL